MADKKITELDEATTLAGDELLPVVVDPSGTAVTQKVKASNVLLPVAKITAATPQGHPGLYAPSSTAPGDGGWVDYNLTADTTQVEESVTTGAAYITRTVQDDGATRLSTTDIFAQGTAVYADFLQQAAASVDDSAAVAQMTALTNAGTLAQLVASNTEGRVTVTGHADQESPLLQLQAPAGDVFTVGPDGACVMGSLGVANSVPATTPGTVTNKIEVFDASGTSLGFVAVYDAIS